jgi:hypothetical protein
MKSSNIALLMAQSMLMHVPFIPEANISNAGRPGMSGTKNGGRPMFKQNRRAQMK